jgi:ClpP class serine protease
LASPFRRQEVTTPIDKFPRGQALPSQSPLFWVSQKDRYLRQLLIRDIQELTKRRLLVYFANRYENAQIDQRDIALMSELCKDTAGLPADLMLETSGGVTDATEGLVSLIQTVVPDLRVIVVSAAKSNGTLLGLAAKSILMGATSELGPIEPQFNGIPCTVLDTPEIAKQNFPLHKAGVFALQQTKALAKRLLTDGMMKGKPMPEIEETVKKLSSRDHFFSHGSVINHREAVQLGLTVEYLPPEDETWQKLWLLYCMYDHDCRRDKYLKVFEGPTISTSIAAPRAAAPTTA